MASLSQLDFVSYTIKHFFSKHRIVHWRTRLHPSLLRWIWCEVQLEHINLFFAESDHAVSSYYQLTTLGLEDSIRYLEISFGKTPTHSMVIKPLGKLFKYGFCVRFRRPPAVRSRRLVAQKKIYHVFGITLCTLTYQQRFLDRSKRYWIDLCSVGNVKKSRDTFA